MPQIPFAIQCTIPEQELRALKHSENECLDSDYVLNIRGFKYFLSIFPNGDNDERHGQTWVFLELKLRKVKMVETDFTVSIESANYFSQEQFTFEKSSGGGLCIADTEDFFKPEMGFIVDGKFTIKVFGTFKFETSDAPALGGEQKWDGGELGKGLWDDDGDRDFTIGVDGKEIKVHKLVLRTRSDVFKAMFHPETKEAIENKVEIPDFSFNIVETAVKMVYNCNFTSSLSLDEMMSLLQFFDKYNIASLKDKVQLLLIDQISAATVCRLTNASVFTNSIQLKKKCMEFLEKSFASKTPLSDIEILDNDVLKKVVQNMVYHTVEIR